MTRLKSKKIVVFRALQMGDMLCTIPAFRLLRKQFPDAKITLVGLSWAKEFQKRFAAYIDEFIEFPGWPGFPEQKVDIKKIPLFIKQIQNKKYDLAIQMQGDGTLANSLLELFGAKIIAGFYTEGNYKPNSSFLMPYKDIHEIKKFCELLQVFGSKTENYNLEFPILKTDIRNYEKLYASCGLSKPYVCIHPGARDVKRRWNAKYFARIADEIIEMGYRVVFTGSKSEEKICKKVRSFMQYEAIDVSGATDLGTLAALIKNSSLLISNDTGVSHIAAAVKTPSIIIFSKYSDPRRWAPLDRNLHCAILPENTIAPYVIEKIKMHINSKIKSQKSTEHLKNQNIHNFTI